MTGAAKPPLFTVIMATWGRGRHILPSITSALQQAHRSFEVIVVGDACSDETEAVVTSLGDPRVRWINLAERCGSQAAPNNAGIAAARGRYIAYLGHDDVWEPTHLSALEALFAGPKPPDIAVSGIILHLPNGLQGGPVTGVFTDDGVKHSTFFPPSCFAHRNDVTDRIGLWNMPGAVRTPVDEDFLRRAAAADLRFASTGVITVHKFTASFRYLSYLCHDTREQEAMLAAMTAAGHAERVAALVAEAKLQGKFLLPLRNDPERLEPGQLARENAKRRGLVHRQARPLGRGASLGQAPDHCALDWSDRPFLGIRLHRINPRPRFLLPFTATGPVKLSLRVVHPDHAAFGPLELMCNDTPVIAQPTGVRRGLFGWTGRYEAVIALRAKQPSVLEFVLDAEKLRKQPLGTLRVGFGIGRVRLTPGRI